MHYKTIAVGETEDARATICLQWFDGPIDGVKRETPPFILLVNGTPSLSLWTTEAAAVSFMQQFMRSGPDD